MNIGILGAGTWGVALAALFCKNGHRVTVWSALAEEIDELAKTHRHKNLPLVALPPEIVYTKDLKAACTEKETVIFAVPSAFFRQTAHRATPFLAQGAVAVSVAKGLEKNTLLTMTDILEDEFSGMGRKDLHAMALSGPTHAEEVAMDVPTSIVAACKDERIAAFVADAFKGSCVRVYTNTDVVGVEICGAMKNIIALAAGICGGMGLGDNTKAMLITRGAHEICRVGLAMGGSMHTFMGLAGFGDLIVTCISKHSRNNRCGEYIGGGMSYEEASARIGMVVEGYVALDAAMELSAKYAVEMPITEAVYDIIHRGVTPGEVMTRLMQREMKSEKNW